MRIVIPGGTGQVGTILIRHFLCAGHDVTVVARHSSPLCPTALWNGRDAGDWCKCLEGADVVINLAGRNVNCRYNEANRRAIKESRVATTRLLGRAIAECSDPPQVWLNASTATIYRHAVDRPMDEQTGELGGGEPGAPDTWRFSIDVAKSWEDAFFSAETPRTRKIALRSAMTMSPDRGGVFDTLLRLVRFGLGGASGPGNQYVSWIHDIDFARAVDFLIGREDVEGIVNVSSPNPLPNREFMREICECWRAPVRLPSPAWMLEAGAVLIQTETELVLKSRRVVPGRLLAAGFDFRFPCWKAAAQDLVRRWRQYAQQPCSAL
jgi:uncharacterized protein (TIGR01777 family)